MNDPLLTPETESLIQGYVEGELTEAECVRLHKLLEASPGLITPLLMSLRTEALIRQTVLQGASADFGTVPGITESKSHRLSRAAIGFAAAACLVVLAFGAMFFREGKTPVTTTAPVLYEYWNGIPGSTVDDLTSHPAFQRSPTGSEPLRKFEAPSRRGENYGARIRAYLHPTVTGNYFFWIAADDAGELWLSLNENPADKKRIGFLESWAPPHEWTWRPSQQSQPISLEAGRRYYIEALHKQGTADDSLAVAWQPPGQTREIIPGSALSPFSQSNSSTFTAPRVVP